MKEKSHTSVYIAITGNHRVAVTEYVDYRWRFLNPLLTRIPAELLLHGKLWLTDRNVDERFY